MGTAQALNKRMSIVALTWPIFAEVLLRTALGTSDVFMLSSYSDKAVSAVGVITQLTFFLIIISAFVSSGTGILISQYNGAGRSEESSQVGVASVMLSLVIGVLLSLLAVAGTIWCLPYYGMEAQVEQYAAAYLLITGAMTFNLTISIVLTTILRSYGYSRSPMVVNLISGICNVIGNYIALFQPFGLPVYGVEGVAVATVCSQVIATLMLCYILARSDIRLPLSGFRVIPKAIYTRILSIGGMNAGEILSYNLAQICITYFVVQMGTSSLAAFTYAQNISRFSFAFSLALGQAAQIQTGYYVGQGRSGVILKKVQRYFVAGFLVSMIVTGSVYLSRDHLLPLFTQDADILHLTGSLLLISVFLEAGRVFNLIFISGLKGAGDIKFPVQIGIVSMWGNGAFLSWLLGIFWGLGVPGAWIAMSADEIIRGWMMMLRWRSKVWMKSARF
ncbi:Multidrug resistance protein NorM [Vibrio aerogenes CECT 7868]|uniref:Multidrug resistance protein NorM n=1 Tax=Vibrio aerogenes CECT 7868 TaxID=1216006 RepID=A0A1M6DIW9_9VIBR|nr:MATE family efflux transporter [Vibrio aerogenes]SHI72958.1 Multidrug resistance protein NorM [Vibrio aerogenes CECT 7868]